LISFTPALKRSEIRAVQTYITGRREIFDSDGMQVFLLGVFAPVQGDKSGHFYREYSALHYEELND
ncbi:MAG: hypothetical protein J5I59_00815, partial [Saprospiraceae bacterium]|nr:hypothetical protein [Saprospiraceae bacterium]